MTHFWIRLLLEGVRVEGVPDVMRPGPHAPDVYSQGVLVGRGRQGEGVVFIPTESLARQTDPLAGLVLEVARPLEGEMGDACNKMIILVH